jgi:hypothetical protein
MIDFIGNKEYKDIHPQITQMFADFSLEDFPICVICEHLRIISDNV